jgi:SAM-dependent methyltransferase
LREAAGGQGLGERVSTVVREVRDWLPLSDASVDAVFAHMLLCMALSTREIRAVVAEVRRVLRPGGVFVYTVRPTGEVGLTAGRVRSAASRVGPAANADALLCRGNADVTHEVLSFLEQGVPVALTGGGSSLERIIKITQELRSDKRTSHSELFLSSRYALFARRQAASTSGSWSSSPRTTLSRTEGTPEAASSQRTMKSTSIDTLEVEVELACTHTQFDHMNSGQN